MDGSLGYAKEDRDLENEIEETNTKTKNYDCVKSIRIRSFSGPYFQSEYFEYSVRMRGNTD